MALPPLQDAQQIDQIMLFVFGQADAKAAPEAVEPVTLRAEPGSGAGEIRLIGKTTDPD